MAQDAQATISVADRSLIGAIERKSRRPIKVRSKLSAGQTNRSYRVYFGDDVAVLRINSSHAAGVDRALEAEILRLLSPLNCVPEILYIDSESALISREVNAFDCDGLPQNRTQAIHQIAACLSQFHAIALNQTQSSLASRLKCYRKQTGFVLDRVDELIHLNHQLNLKLGHQPVLLHRDLNSGNVLWTDNGPRFIDWEYAGSGPRILDLASFSHHHLLSESEQTLLLELCNATALEHDQMPQALQIVAKLNALWSNSSAIISDD